MTTPRNDISTPIDEHFYRLVDREPVRCTLSEYAESLQSESSRIVMQTAIGELLVSTVFTGIDYSFGLGEKRLFETLVFGLPDDLHPKWQHSTWDQATGHHESLAGMLRENGAKALLQLMNEKTGNHP